LQTLLGSDNPFVVYYDALQEGAWVRTLDPQLRSASLVRIQEEGRNPETIDSLVAYDKPDIILVHRNRPVLVIEKTSEVPSAHNCGQRFARIARAAECGIPFIYFFPFVAQKHGSETVERERQQKTNQRYVNPRLFDASARLEAIFDAVVIHVCWPVDTHYELLTTPEKDTEIARVVRQVVEWSQSQGPIARLRTMAAIRRARLRAEREGQARKEASAKNRRLPPSVRIEETSAMINRYRITGAAISRLSARRRSLVYTIGMRYVRSDPYAGMLIFYDYLCARTGRTTQDRSMNLVASMPNIESAEWNQLSSENQGRKDIRLFRIFSDCILLRDAVLT